MATGSGGFFLARAFGSLAGAEPTEALGHHTRRPDDFIGRGWLDGSQDLAKASPREREGERILIGTCVRGVRKNRNGGGAIANDDQPDSALRNAMVRGIDKADLAAETTIAERFPYDSQGFTRLAGWPPCGKETAHVLEDDHPATTLVGQSDEVAEQLAARIIEAFLLAGAAPRLAGRTARHQRDFTLLSTHPRENIATGKLANISTLEDGLRRKGRTLILAKGSDGVRVGINRVKALPSSSFQAKVEAAGSGEEAEKLKWVVGELIHEFKRTQKRWRCRANGDEPFRLLVEMLNRLTLLENNRKERSSI